MTSAGQLRLARVKPDVWGPHVSVRGLNRVSLILTKGLVALGPTVSVMVK